MPDVSINPNVEKNVHSVRVLPSKSTTHEVYEKVSGSAQKREARTTKWGSRMFMIKRSTSTVMSPKEFSRVSTDDPHKQRRRDIIQAHPEIRRLTGRNPYSMLLIVSVVTAQLTTAYLLRTSSLWLILIGAYCRRSISRRLLNCDDT